MAGDRDGEVVVAEEAAEACGAVGRRFKQGAGPPYSLDEVMERIVGGLGGHVLVEQSGWCAFPGVIVGEVVYDHHRAHLGDRLTKLQHHNANLVVSTTHVHLTHDLCLEVIILRGPARRLQKIASQLKGLKGIHKGELVADGHTDEILDLYCKDIIN